MRIGAPRALREWATLVVWLGIAAALWGTDRQPLMRVGATVDVDTSLVAADATDAWCGSDRAYAGYFCPLMASGAPRAAAAPDSLFPCMTPERQLVLVPGLHQQPAIARREGEELSVPRAEQKRFRVRCRGRIVGRANDVRVRWLASARLGPPESAWVIAPWTCLLM